MAADPDLLAALRIQSEVCREFGSPFNGAMLAHMARDLEAGGPVAELLAPWAGAGRKAVFYDAVPLRLINAFSHLAASGEAPALTAAYPAAGRAGDADAAWEIASGLIATHRGHLTGFMSHEPQTNEVRRSICLLGGFLTVAGETGLPLRCFEIGASAGLNQFWDLFAYRIGEAEWGDPASTVRMTTEWSGPLPPLGPAAVIERAACDRRPTDLTDPAERRRLLANIWPDQFDRLERSRHAIEIALANGVAVEQADALDWVRARVRPRAGAATVLYHSVFWQYLSEQTQAGLVAAVEALGAAATRDAPFAWLRMESPPGSLASMDVRLTLWPGGEERKLAEVHPHGAWVRWEAQAAGAEGLAMA